MNESMVHPEKAFLAALEIGDILHQSCSNCGEKHSHIINVLKINDINGVRKVYFSKIFGGSDDDEVTKRIILSEPASEGVLHWDELSSSILNEDGYASRMFRENDEPWNVRKAAGLEYVALFDKLPHPDKLKSRLDEDSFNSYIDDFNKASDEPDQLRRIRSIAENAQGFDPLEVIALLLEELGLEVSNKNAIALIMATKIFVPEEEKRRINPELVVELILASGFIDRMRQH